MLLGLVAADAEGAGHTVGHVEQVVLALGEVGKYRVASNGHLERDAGAAPFREERQVSLRLVEHVLHLARRRKVVDVKEPRALLLISGGRMGIRVLFNVDGRFACWGSKQRARHHGTTHFAQHTGSTLSVVIVLSLQVSVFSTRGGMGSLKLSKKEGEEEQGEEGEEEEEHEEAKKSVRAALALNSESQSLRLWSLRSPSPRGGVSSRSRSTSSAHSPRMGLRSAPAANREAIKSSVVSVGDTCRPSMDSTFTTDSGLSTATAASLVVEEEEAKSVATNSTGNNTTRRKRAVEAASRGLVISALGGAGRSCSATLRPWVVSHLEQEFVSALLKAEGKTQQGFGHNNRGLAGTGMQYVHAMPYRYVLQ